MFGGQSAGKVRMTYEGLQDEAHISVGPDAAVILSLDAEGGDRAPGEVVAGALEAADSDLRLLLVGRPEVLKPHLMGVDCRYLEVVPSRSVIGCLDEPASAVRSMPDSSIMVAARSVAEGRSHGLVSAGSTGAVLAASLFVIKRASGIQRPAIVTALPGERGPVALLDSGANADCRPEHLLEFGIMGAAFARTALNVREPKIGLLNIGEEETKGRELARAAHTLLATSGLNFVGNVEGRDVLTGAVDVVVTDGFTGNVVLKLLEGSAQSLLSRMRQAASSSFRAKIGGMLLRPALRDLQGSIDPEEYGGAYLLGVRGLVVICHGNSSRRAIANALRFGARAVRQGILAAVDEELAKLRLGN